MFDKAKQQYDLIKKAKSLQKELKDTEIEAQSKDGKVKVVFTGEQHLSSIKIDDSLLTADSKTELERALVSTISEAISRAQAFAAEKTREMMKGMNMDFPGL